MSRKAYIFRACLYIVIAVLPIIKDGIMNHTGLAIVVLTACIEASLTTRAFIDKSPSEHEATKAAAVTATATAAASAPSEESIDAPNP